MALLVWGGTVAVPGSAQQARAADSVTIPASDRYDRSSTYRWLFGEGYRELWGTPIRVPVLDLATFDGGLVADELGGGNATLSLRFDAADGSRYVFRTVDKQPRNMPDLIEDTPIAKDVAWDRTASTHPAANVAHAPFYDAVGVIHEEDSRLYVLPDDERLGEWRELMAGRLGVLSRHPAKDPELVPEYQPGAIAIADSDSLILWIKRRPSERVHPTQYLTARLVDMLLNNWDRHPGNWKWARLREGGPWHPISRDMDNVFVSQDGLLPELARHMTPKAVTFDSTFPALRSLVYKGGIIDRRVLMGTPREAFDSIARFVRDRITDEVIAASMARMPREYASSWPSLTGKLQARRDSLPAVADRWFLWINEVADIHGTDVAERATITRVDDQTVRVEIAEGAGSPYFDRRFRAGETREIRLYLHGGDDHAIIRGDVARSIPLRIIGGNGRNVLVDSSRVGGGAEARLHDVGDIDDVEYGVDTVWNRRALVMSPEGQSIPLKDFGRGGGPLVDVSSNRDMGLMPELGWAWERYGFRQHPYATRVELEGRYSFRNDGWAAELRTDHRLADSRLHYRVHAGFSQLALLNYHGLGNSTPRTPGVPVGERSPRDGFFAVQQDQWLLHPALAYGLGEDTEIRLGPLVQHTVSEGPAGGYLETTQPYGAGSFTEGGLRAAFVHDTREGGSSHPTGGALFDVRADWFPAMFDVRESFGAVRATLGGFLTLPLPLDPYVGLRVTGQKVFGDFPFHEAAFIGGRSGGVRILDPQRYAGDAALAAKASLRVPLLTIPFLVPLETGAFVEQEVGRVYVDGASPDGWHNAFGAGFWVGFRSIRLTIRLVETNESGRPAPPEPLVGID
jgi:hypothetical protein